MKAKMGGREGRKEVKRNKEKKIRKGEEEGKRLGGEMVESKTESKKEEKHLLTKEKERKSIYDHQYKQHFLLEEVKLEIVDLILACHMNKFIVI